MPMTHSHHRIEHEGSPRDGRLTSGAPSVVHRARQAVVTAACSAGSGLNRMREFRFAGDRRGTHAIIIMPGPMPCGSGAVIKFDRLAV